MALFAAHKNTEFGVGDTVRVVQKIKEGDKQRSQAFEGMVIGIKGRGENKSFTVRRIGSQQIGIERIFPLLLPSLETVEVIRGGFKGSRRAKLYYIRDKSRREIEKIYSRVKKKNSEPVSKLTSKNKSSK